MSKQKKEVPSKSGTGHENRTVFCSLAPGGAGALAGRWGPTVEMVGYSHLVPGEWECVRANDYSPLRAAPIGVIGVRRRRAPGIELMIFD